MKYLVMVLLLVGCASVEVSDETHCLRKAEKMGITDKDMKIKYFEGCMSRLAAAEARDERFRTNLRKSMEPKKSSRVHCTSTSSGGQNTTDCEEN